MLLDGNLLSNFNFALLAPHCRMLKTDNMTSGAGLPGRGVLDASSFILAATKKRSITGIPTLHFINLLEIHDRDKYARNR